MKGFMTMKRCLSIVVTLLLPTVGCTGSPGPVHEKDSGIPQAQKEEASPEVESGESIPGWPESVERVSILSSYDSTPQPALFQAPPAGGGGNTVGGREPPSGARGANGRSGACSAVSVNCTVQERCSLVSTSK